MLTRCFEIGNWRAELICHVSQVVDVGETTHIQQVLASKVAELHGIDTVQSLQTLENLVPWVNIPTCSMYGISTHILASIYGTCKSIFHTFGAYGIHQSRKKKVHEKLPYMALCAPSTILPSWCLRLRIANWLWMNGRLFFHVAGPLVRALREATHPWCNFWLWKSPEDQLNDAPEAWHERLDILSPDLEVP